MSRLFTTGSRRWKLLRLRVFNRDGWRCVQCGRASRFECDHKIPVERGGDRWDPENLQTLCRPCHFRKTSRENEREDPARERWRAFRDALRS